MPLISTLSAMEAPSGEHDPSRIEQVACELRIEQPGREQPRGNQRRPQHQSEHGDAAGAADDDARPRQSEGGATARAGDDQRETNPITLSQAGRPQPLPGAGHRRVAHQQEDGWLWVPPTTTSDRATT